MVHSRATVNTQPRSSAWSFLGLGEPSGASGITEVAETGDYNLGHANPSTEDSAPRHDTSALCA